MDERPASLQLAPGLHAVTREDGSIYVEPSGERKNHTIAFRLTAAGYSELMPFIESFPQAQKGAALRWLLDHPDVRRVMDERIRSATFEVSRAG